ncbi:hypothetical protein [Synechococcus sp. UW105]|nr:hypothetical protein [Synechococcus sp. UW105]
MGHPHESELIVESFPLKPPWLNWEVTGRSDTSTTLKVLDINTRAVSHK